MGKTLRNIILGMTAAAVVAGSFLVGMNIDKIKEKLQNTSSPSEITFKKPENKEIKKSLESYFLQGDELKYAPLSSVNYANPADNISPINPFVVNRENLPEEGRIEAESRKILRVGFGNYMLPNLEYNSEMKNLTLGVMEFESAKDREEFMKNTEVSGLLTYPLFAKDNILSIIQPTIEDSRYLSPIQKKIYTSLLREYINRTGADPLLSKDPEEQKTLLKTIKESPILVAKKSEENNAESGTISNSDQTSANVPTGNITNEPANIVTGLEKYLFQDKELRFLELSKENASYHQLEEGGALTIPYELFTRQFTSNPAVIKGILEEGNIKEFFDKSKIEEFEWASYNIPEREPYSKEHNLTLFLFKFKGDEAAKQFLTKEDSHTRFPAFIKGDVMSVIYSPTFEFVYKYNMLTNEQQVMYMDLVFDYRDRTGMKLILSNDKDLMFLEQLRKRYTFELRKN